jgi:succinylarginine dihydrolase
MTFEPALPMTHHKEYNFDGLVGPTHNYGGLSLGNVASMAHEGKFSNPRLAALEGLQKMRFVHALGVGQAVLPPHDRPSIRTLRRLGFAGSDEEVLASAASHSDFLVRLVTSAAPMWTANAATVAPSCDAQDGKLHITPANLKELFHRAIEAEVTHRILRVIFADARHFVVHRPLPGGAHFADEGAANHTRLFHAEAGGAHLFAWGRSSFGEAPATRRFPARQSREASEAIARLHELPEDRVIFAQQHPEGIDAGAFHTDVLAVGTESLLLMHELAFLDGPAIIRQLKSKVDSLRVVVATDDEFPLDAAVRSYAFNSQLVVVEGGAMILVSPGESRENPKARAFLERVLESDNPVHRIEYFDLRQSMQNGGGPACLRLRVPLADHEVASLGARVLFSAALDAELVSWVKRHYRDRVFPADLRDPALARESFTALDELTKILRLGSIYDFQT